MSVETAPLTQEALTKRARRKGRKKVERDWQDAKARGREALTKIGSAVVHQLVNSLMDLLIDDLEKLTAGRAVPGGAALRFLMDAPIPEVCLAVTKAAVNGMSREWVSGISLQSRLGAAAEDAILDARWRKLNPEQAKAVRAIVSRATDPLSRRLAKKAYAKGWQREVLSGGRGWDEKTTKLVGAALMAYLVRLGMLQHSPRLIVTGKRRTNGVQLTERAGRWISSAHEFAASAAEVQYPCVDRPIPWTAPLGGGFHGRGTLDHPSVPSNQRPFWMMRNARKEHKDLLRQADLSTTYAALNAAQGTGWHINPKVLETVEELRRVGKGGAGLTLADTLPKPVLSPAADEATRKKFKADSHAYYERLLRLVQERRVEHRIVETARLFKDSERFHFVYNTDFRGRVYVCSDYLSPQGNDLQRGLLEFAEGDPLDAESLWWLKLHLANTYGKDKESFDERIAWANANAQWFERLASNPVDLVGEWEQADSPWQFLAACFAWKDYRDGKGECRLPIMLDGSCSGIQHSAALIRDLEAGSQVNLVPRPSSEPPADIYATVADVAREVLKERVAQLDTEAHRWLHQWKPSRADTKSTVMTLPYGGTRFGNFAQVRQSVEKQIRKGSKDRPDWLSRSTDNRTDYSRSMHLLSAVVWDAACRVVKAPLEVMDYFKDCGRSLRVREKQLRQEQPMAEKAKRLRFSWISPSGFPVLADYRTAKKRRTSLTDPETGRSLAFEYYAATEDTDWKVVVTTAPPHFIHSLDAAHLVRSIARAADEGIEQVAVVHDAFGATPAKIGRLAQVLRDEFVRMYSGDVLEATLGKMLDDAGAIRPPVPERGQLDLNAVARSAYMFA